MHSDFETLFGFALEPRLESLKVKSLGNMNGCEWPLGYRAIGGLKSEPVPFL